jgi:hypothetical protein
MIGSVLSLRTSFENQFEEQGKTLTTLFWQRHYFHAA